MVLEHQTPLTTQLAGGGRVTGPVSMEPVTIRPADMGGADRLVRVIDALADAFADLSAGRTRSPSRTIVEHGDQRQLLVGPAVLGLVEVNEVLRVFSELGVVFLLFWVGLETKLSEMRAVGRIAVTVGSAGVVLPFLAGIGLGLALGENTETSVFLGAALAATSAGITSATFLDLGIARSRAARTVLGAA